MNLVYLKMLELKSKKTLTKRKSKHFFGIVMSMGLGKMPSVTDYWSTSKLYK